MAWGDPSYTESRNHSFRVTKRILFAVGLTSQLLPRYAKYNQRGSDGVSTRVVLFLAYTLLCIMLMIYFAKTVAYPA